jgi:hypothetical protein
VATSLPGGCLRVAALPAQRISLIAKIFVAVDGSVIP